MSGIYFVDVRGRKIVASQSRADVRDDSEGFASRNPTFVVGNQEIMEWHNVVFGEGYAAAVRRFHKGTHIFVECVLIDHSEYDRTIEVPTGKIRKIEYTIKELVMELKANSIWLLDRPNTHEVGNDAVEPSFDEQVNFYGACPVSVDLRAESRNSASFELAGSR